MAGMEGWPDGSGENDWKNREERAAGEERRQVRGDEVARGRGGMGEEERRETVVGKRRVHGMDCSIVKCVNAPLKKRTVVGLAPRSAAEGEREGGG